ncbi:hypothetical protein AJ79_05697 [Helicocarpus griseus UAMH5409]|uniref:Uncharacterized protein n=1 Tax=Helicocarpus griseus UAMH5409 TaxID=1447875 RepID=A0A2B7XKD1_9EURO|nr:hypothetical protein AJ79_05697 [Helicocarpus griseus UAMH5409]
MASPAPCPPAHIWRTASCSNRPIPRGALFSSQDDQSESDASSGMTGILSDNGSESESNSDLGFDREDQDDDDDNANDDCFNDEASYFRNTTWPRQRTWMSHILVFKDKELYPIVSCYCLCLFLLPSPHSHG